MSPCAPVHFMIDAYTCCISLSADSIHMQQADTVDQVYLAMQTDIRVRRNMHCHVAKNRFRAANECTRNFYVPRGPMFMPKLYAKFIGVLASLVA